MNDKICLFSFRVNRAEGSGFWCTPRELSEEDEEMMARHRESVLVLDSAPLIEEGEFQRVTHTCKVRLPSGRLCPRQDRIKCPFHGMIIPRDDAGRPVDPVLAAEEDAVLEASSAAVDELEEAGAGVASDEEDEPVPEWQDPELLQKLKVRN